MLVSSPTLKRPRLILFDLDGTLVDTAPDLAFAIDSTLQNLKLPVCGESKVRGWIGSGIEGVMKRALSRDESTEVDKELYERALHIFKDIYFDKVCIHSKTYAGTHELLQHLSDEGFQIGCVTNKAARYTEKLLHALNLHHFFGIIVSGDTLSVKKPEPEPILHAADYFSVSITETWMVGDSLTDIRAARAAKCPIVCVPYGYNRGHDIAEFEPDAIVENLFSIISLIDTSN